MHVKYTWNWNAQPPIKNGRKGKMESKCSKTLKGKNYKAFSDSYKSGMHVDITRITTKKRKSKRMNNSRGEKLEIKKCLTDLKGKEEEKKT